MSVLSHLLLLLERQRWGVIFVSLVLLPLLLPEPIDEPVARRVVRELFRPVQPGRYTPRACGQWHFLPDSEALLEALSHELSAYAGAELLGANHVSLPVCLLAWRGAVLVNPRIVVEYAKPRMHETRTPRLCAAGASPVLMPLSDSFEIEWRLADASVQRKRVKGAEALHLHRALRILEGHAVCGLG